jgi:hypothetical protein
MADLTGKKFDENAALGAVWERLAAPHPRDILKRDYEWELKGYPAILHCRSGDPILRKQ